MPAPAEPVDHDPVEIVSGAILRPVEWQTLLWTSRAPVLLYLLAAAGALALLGFTPAVRSLGAVIGAAAGAVVVAAGIGGVVFARPQLLRRHAGPAVLASIVFAGPLITAAAAGFGPAFPVLLVGYPSAVIFSFALLRLPWALATVGLVGVESALLFALQDGWHQPAGQWLVLTLSTLGVSITAGLLAARTMALARGEQTARAELADLNAGLRDEVARQVEALERAGELRRFLAPQVADAVLAGDPGDTLRPHRRRVAVFFCDLRGFTAFAAQVEPEDVMDVLGGYYRVVGEQLRASGATVGGFAGDGIMAYLNDPVPCADPAGEVVAMAVAVRTAMSAEIGRWRRLGYDLGLGIGVAVGHATLGVVGYEGRNDYTALGTVVNLAARLCAAAADGQILVDPRTAETLAATVCTDPVEGVVLKGFPPEMTIRAVREVADETPRPTAIG